MGVLRKEGVEDEKVTPIIVSIMPVLEFQDINEMLTLKSMSLSEYEIGIFTRVGAT